MAEYQWECPYCKGRGIDPYNKAGIKNYQYHIGNEADTDWLKAICFSVTLSTANVGLLGYRAAGFFNIGVDELNLYKNTGALTEHYELQELYDTESDTAATSDT